MNQIVLVTGASSGFGRMIADALAGAGHTVHAEPFGQERTSGEGSRRLFAGPRGRGLLVWIGSGSVAGGVPPLLGPYLGAGIDALAVAYARELAPLGTGSSIVVPGAFTKGTNHFANAGDPDDKVSAADYARGWPDGADPVEVAPAVIDRVREQFLDRIGFADLRHPAGRARHE